MSISPINGNESDEKERVPTIITMMPRRSQPFSNEEKGKLFVQVKEGMGKLLLVRVQAVTLAFLLMELVGPNTHWSRQR
ncbi:hypothetical protein KSF_066080 [Reticulibacter mediterranei]|uniref:Uncharacterized protein n=1 Tax=Reticulibacter mediterranei TaxID=2778369 RepID=A0A8J3IQB4_9CHLR|nr:hypothetical protein KSF_066080 [Reticulibacter mediterranei]